MTGSFVQAEIASQPACWTEAIAAAGPAAATLPQPGERAAVIGCGTSLFVAQAYAVLRESIGAGETDAFAASEMPLGRRYDRVVALSRSGTTTEVLRALEALRDTTPTVAITADPSTEIVDLADETVVLGFADERSIVQTRVTPVTLDDVFLELTGKELRD